MNNSREKDLIEILIINIKYILPFSILLSVIGYFVISNERNAYYSVFISATPNFLLMDKINLSTNHIEMDLEKLNMGYLFTYQSLPGEADRTTFKQRKLKVLTNYLGSTKDALNAQILTDKIKGSPSLKNKVYSKFQTDYYVDYQVPDSYTSRYGWEVAIKLTINASDKEKVKEILKYYSETKLSQINELLNEDVEALIENYYYYIADTIKEIERSAVFEKKVLKNYLEKSFNIANQLLSIYENAQNSEDYQRSNEILLSFNDLINQSRIYNFRYYIYDMINVLLGKKYIQQTLVELEDGKLDQNYNLAVQQMKLAEEEINKKIFDLKELVKNNDFFIINDSNSQLIKMYKISKYLPYVLFIFGFFISLLFFVYINYKKEIYK